MGDKIILTGIGLALTISLTIGGLAAIYTPPVNAVRIVCAHFHCHIFRELPPIECTIHRIPEVDSPICVPH